MVRKIPSTEARRGFGELLDQVRAGESISITQNGRVVARLVPPDSRSAPLTLDEALESLHRLTPLKPLQSGEIRPFIEDGRRF